MLPNGIVGDTRVLDSCIEMQAAAAAAAFRLCCHAVSLLSKVMLIYMLMGSNFWGTHFLGKHNNERHLRVMGARTTVER